MYGFNSCMNDRYAIPTLALSVSAIVSRLEPTAAHYGQHSALQVPHAGHVHDRTSIKRETRGARRVGARHAPHDVRRRASQTVPVRERCAVRGRGSCTDRSARMLVIAS